MALTPIKTRYNSETGRNEVVERGAEAAAWAKRAEEEAKAACLAPTRGARVRVVKGRKVPKGTEGVVIWEGVGEYGTRIGIKDDAGTVHWTAASNAERIIEKRPDETWVDRLVRLNDQAAIPKWALVQFVAGDDTWHGNTGTVFYSKDERVGVATTNRKRQGRYLDVIWTSAENLKVLEVRDSEPEWVDDSLPAPADADETIPF